MAADDDLPDVEFLEYLGSWEDSDEDWLMIDKETQKDGKKKDKRDVPEPEGEESAVLDDDW